MRSWLGLFLATSLSTFVVVACGSGGDQPGPGPVGPDAADDTYVPPFQGAKDAGEGGPAASNSCQPLTCKQLAVGCGPTGDGCGNIIDCGSCAAPQTCGGGTAETPGKPFTCGGDTTKPLCKPLTCTDLGANCGQAGDGCGGVIDCGKCDVPTTCGGGGTPSKCGGDTGCRPRTCSDLGAECGPAGDGCGGVIQCGQCQKGFSCTGAPAKCVADPTADASTCVPLGCADVHAGCGPAGDGCGHIIQCGNCTPPASCGGGTTLSQCGGNSVCIPKTCKDLGINCGPAGDGCGGLLQCGNCTAPQSCGGGSSTVAGRPGICGGTSVCVPKTCKDLGAECGSNGDGCGGVINCGTCQGDNVCGGGTPQSPGKPNKCGGGTATPNCTSGLCKQQVVCAPGVTTTLTGTVRAPTPATFLAKDANGNYYPPDPIPFATVYIPTQNTPPPAFTPDVSCSRCGTDLGATPLVKAVTDAHGNFTLPNVPVGTGIPVVIQVGRWRRVLHVDVTQCVPNAVPDFDPTNPSSNDTKTARLPRNKGEGDIPLTAVSTGAVDGLECVLRKIGVAENEFTTSDGNGRIQLFTGDPDATKDPAKGTYSVLHFGAQAAVGGAQHKYTDLTASIASMSKYDQIIFACEGTSPNPAANGRNTPNPKDPTQQGYLVQYANSGGRVLASHYEYAWLRNVTPFSGTADWTQANKDASGSLSGCPGAAGPPGQGCAPIPAIIDESTSPKVKTFGQWLKYVNGTSGTDAATGFDTLNILQPRFNVNFTTPLSTMTGLRWIYTPGPTNPVQTLQHFTFNTPIGVPDDQQCGRVVFSDFHVADTAVSDSTLQYTFPAECNNNPMTAQERVLEFMIFDLGNCVQPDIYTPASCAPKTCADLGLAPGSGGCGPVGDGCGNTVNCGTCTPPQTCGGGGQNLCGGTACVKLDCGNVKCGPVGDGCGGQVNCGDCVAPDSCGGGGTPGQCGHSSCVPRSCGDVGANCGAVGDGCGATINCGTCTPPETCGGGGSPNVCGIIKCTPKTVQKDCTGKCGQIEDGCGGIIDCGPCPAGQFCGGGNPDAGGGTPNVCGGSANCTKLTCGSANTQCGPIADGCGGTVDCGPCTNPKQTCGGSGKSGICGAACTPITCATAGENGTKAECGEAGDGCGSVINCGPCTAPDTCGGGGTPFKCGHAITH